MAVYLGSVRAISGPPSRQTANRGRPAGPVYYVNLPTFGPSIARLLNAARAILGPPGFSNEKACPTPLVTPCDVNCCILGSNVILNKRKYNTIQYNTNKAFPEI